MKRTPFARRTRKPMKRYARLTPSRTRVGAKARKRRKLGGKVAIGRPSGTRAEIARERKYVRIRANGECELCALKGQKVLGTDFAHVISRAQGGRDHHENALWTCNADNLRMQGDFKRGRWVVKAHVWTGDVWTDSGLTPATRITFHARLVVAPHRAAYEAGDGATMAAGWIKAECPDAERETRDG